MVAEVVASEASVGELEEAVSEPELDYETDERPVEPSPPRVHELRVLLGELLDVSDDGSAV